MSTITTTSDLDVLMREIRGASIQTIASHLQDVLSRRVTAYVVGVREARTVTRWANGTVSSVQDIEQEKRLRAAYGITLLLAGAGESDASIKGWFVGYVPALRDSPADALRTGRIADAYDTALATAAT